MKINAVFSSILIYIGIVVLIWVVIYAMVYLLSKVFEKTTGFQTSKAYLENNFLTAVGFSVLGLTTGLLTGSSLSPVVKDVVPAILTFIGGMTIYLVAREEKEVVNINIINLAMISFCFFMLYGTERGSLSRLAFQEKNKSDELEFQKSIESHKATLEKELRIMQFQIDSSLLEIEHQIKNRAVKDTLNAIGK